MDKTRPTVTCQQQTKRSLENCVFLTLEILKKIHFICKYRVTDCKSENVDSRGG